MFRGKQSQKVVRDKSPNPLDPVIPDAIPLHLDSSDIRANIFFPSFKNQFELLPES